MLHAKEGWLTQVTRSGLSENGFVSFSEGDGGTSEGSFVITTNTRVVSRVRRILRSLLAITQALLRTLREGQEWKARSSGGHKRWGEDLKRMARPCDGIVRWRGHAKKKFQVTGCKIQVKKQRTAKSVCPSRSSWLAARS